MRKATGMFWKQIGALALVLAMVLGCVPGSMLTAKAEAGTLAKVSDPGTVNDWQAVFQNNTANVGGVWTDKSVFSSAEDYTRATDENEDNAAQNALKLEDENSFLVALSAISSTKTITGYSTKPTDTMLILDLSGSMEGSVSAMVTAANKAIGDLLELNSHNRVGVVLFSGNSSFGNSSTSTATVLMPLNRYTTTSSTLNGTPRYLQSNNSETVSVVSGVRPNTNLGSAKATDGGTYTQNGIYQAMQQLKNADQKVIPEGFVQAGMTRMPIMVLMSDGEPTAATRNYTNIGTSNVGEGRTGTDYQEDMSFLTQLTAAYAKREIEKAYGVDSRFYTLGYNIDDLAAAICVLDPDYALTPPRIKNLWSTFIAKEAGDTFQINAMSGQNKTVTKHSDQGYTKPLEDYRYYTDRYFEANRSSELSAAFQSIVDEIVIQSMYYPTKVDGSVHSDGYVEFHDYIGANMEVKGIKGIQMGANLYTGKNFAQQLLSGSGSVENPSDLGDNIVWAVRERLQLTGNNAVQQARDIIDTAYNYGQLAYNASTGEFSNYIGWYSDQNGKYLASWDGGEMTGVSGAAYAVKSYFFLDAVGSGHRETDTLYAMVQVRTHLQTGVEEVHAKLPASLIPLVQYTIKLQGSDPTKVTSVTKEGTSFPSRLIYEVGLSSQIDLLDIENTAPRQDELETEYTTTGEHGNLDSTHGTYVFYTNEWQRGIEHDDSDHLPNLGQYNTHVFFQPSEANERYYYHEDMPVYEQLWNGSYRLYTGDSAPSGSNYYRLRYIYTVNSTNVEQEYERIPTEVIGRARRTDNGGWAIPMGTVFRMQTRPAVEKTSNPTGTLGHSEHTQVHQTSTLPYHIDGILGNNGKLTLTPYQGVKVTKELVSPLTYAGPYTFVVQANNVTEAKLIKEINGTRTSSTLAFNNGVATFTLNAGETAWVVDLPAGTQVTITEESGTGYEVASINGSALSAFKTTITAGQIESAAFANREVTKGQLTISKNVISDIAAHKTDKEFEFEIRVEHSAIQAGDTSFPAVKSDGSTMNLTAVQDGNNNLYLKNDGENVKLKHLETLTIQELPDGTSVTVKEINLPTGFTATQNDQPASITKGGNAVLTFENTYQATEATEPKIDIVGTKTLVAPEGSDWDDSYIFEFVLEKLVGNNWATVSSTNSTAEDSVEYESQEFADKGSVTKTFTKMGMFGESFSQAGTYSYRVREIIPESAANGIVYDAKNCYFDVIVTDNAEGQLIISEVRAGADTTVAQDETTQKWTVNVAFTNQYVVDGSAEAVIGVKKVINGGNSNVVIPPEGFQFALYTADEHYNIDQNVQPILSDPTSSAGLANISIIYQDLDTYYYVLKEIVPEGSSKETANGTITYGNTEYHVQVDVGDEDGNYTVSLQVMKPDGEMVAEADGTLSGGNICVAQISDLVFTNMYTPRSVELAVPISGIKILTGREITENEFWIDGYSTGADFKIDTNAAFAGSAQIGVNGIFSMPKKTYTAAGNYYYVLKERLPEGATAENGYTLNGVTYDTTEYHVTVTVSGDNSTGKLTAQVTSVARAGTVGGVTNIVFRNRYTASNANARIAGTKTLTGDLALQANMFTFELYQTNNAFEVTGMPVQTTKNRAPVNGSAGFAFAMNYDKPGTYYYVVKEQIPASDNGIDYDNKEYQVTVTVTDSGAGQLIAAVKQDAGGIAFTNAYSANPVTVKAITGTKTLDGDTLEAGEFTFELWKARKEAGGTGRVFAVGNQPVQTVYNDGNGHFAFDQLTFNTVGDYWYIVKETVGNEAGMVYDTTLHYVEINVKNNLMGQLIADVKINGSSNGTIQFNNESHPEDVVLSFAGQKTLSNATLAADQFTFELYRAAENGDLTDIVPMLTAKNDANGSFTFVQGTDKRLTFNHAGTWYYVIKEQLPMENGMPVTFKDGIVYDQSEYFIRVIIEERSVSGRKTLVPSISLNKDGRWVEYAANDVSFNNQYQSDNGELILSGTKSLTGRAMSAGEFSFGLYDANGNLIDSVSNDAAGNFTFQKLIYKIEANQTVNYKYTVREIPGSDPTITYDPTVYIVEVSVSDNNAGGILLTHTINGSAEGKITFTNTYTKPENVTAKINIQKEVVSKTQSTVSLKDFTFVLTNGNGKTEVLSDDNGRAGFQLTFDVDDIGKSFEFKVSEQEGLIAGMTYDPMVYTIAIHVGQNADGTLALTINGQSTDTVNLRFTNIYAGVTPPATGDRFPVMLMSVMMLISVAGIAVILLSTRRKHS